jgi:endoglucanase
VTAHDSIYFTGDLSEEKQSRNSSIVTKVADFSSFKREGIYTISIPEVGNSYSFTIGKDVFSDVSKAVIKAFYFIRSDLPLDVKYAGKWARHAGHADTRVLVHPSAATEIRPTGTIISSPKGWYDAGDYNKYIVNSGITMATLLSAYEDFPEYFNKLKTNIPESGDAVPDLLNEVLYNLRWMLSMQDPSDGGVYHKLTNAAFDGMVAPGVTKDPRYVVQKKHCGNA